MRTLKILNAVLAGFLLVLIVGAIAGAVSIPFLIPYFEAKSFNECTGGNASYLNAVFTELRVDDCKK